MTTREIVTAYIRAIEAQQPDEVDRYQHPDLELTEHPNRVSPAGMRADLAGMRAAGERGRKLMASQRYEIRQMIVEGDRAAVQIAWSGTLAAAAGPLPAGARDARPGLQHHRAQGWQGLAPGAVRLLPVRRAFATRQPRPRIAARCYW